MSATMKSYVPPAMRRQLEAAKAAEPLEAGDLKSADLFPSLGKALPAGGAAKWQQIRERLVVPVATQNAFAALDEDGQSTPTRSVAVPKNFKEMIEDRIKREAEEAEAAAAAAAAGPVEDPLLMTEAELGAAGWQALRIPGTAEAIQEMTAKWREPAEIPDFYTNGEPFETMGVQLGNPAYSINSTVEEDPLAAYYAQKAAAAKRPKKARVEPLTERILARARAVLAR